MWKYGFGLYEFGRSRAQEPEPETGTVGNIFSRAETGTDGSASQEPRPAKELSEPNTGFAGNVPCANHNRTAPNHHHSVVCSLKKLESQSCALGKNGQYFKVLSHKRCARCVAQRRRTLHNASFNTMPKPNCMLSCKADATSIHG